MNTPPSRDPANDSETGALKEIYRKMAMRTFCQLPAKIVSYDRDNNTATVAPMIAVWKTDGGVVPRALIEGIPVIALGGGRGEAGTGTCHTFPLKAGDLGWIEASDRDMSIWLQTLKEARPGTVRIHAIEDSRFLPDVYRKYTLPTEPGISKDTAHVWQTTDGESFIAIIPDGASEIIIRSVSGLELRSVGEMKFTTEAALTVNAAASMSITTPKLTVNASDSVSINTGTLTIKATTNISGNVNIQGKVVINGALVVNGIDFSSHTHIGNKGAPTSPPQ